MTSISSDAKKLKRHCELCTILSASLREGGGEGGKKKFNFLSFVACLFERGFSCEREIKMESPGSKESKKEKQMKSHSADFACF